jgi:hypothetical protein
VESSLRWVGGGLGAAHTKPLPSVGGAAPRSHPGDRNGPLVVGDNESLANGRKDSECGNLLLPASDAAEGGDGEDVT